VRLRLVAPAAALGGAVAAAGVLLLMPAASAPLRVAQPPASTAVAGPQEGGQVEEPAPKGLPVGVVTPGYGSARTGPTDVPVGFARSADGAAAAATAWLATVEGSGVLDGRRRNAVLAAIGDSGFVAVASARLADRAASLGLDRLGRPAAGHVLATVWASRGAYRVVSFDAGVALIEVWHLYQLETVAPGAQPGPGRWRRATVVLRWDGGAGDWRVVADFRFADGPDPQVPHPSRLERTEVLADLGEGWRLYADTRE
jgi:hypothetical protein